MTAMPISRPRATGLRIVGCRTMLREPVARGELVELFEDWRIDPMPLHVAYLPNWHVSAKLRIACSSTGSWN